MRSLGAIVGVATISFVLASLAGCSREAGDWRAAQGADTSESYDAFLKQHPQSEFAIQARERMQQLGEERDWQRASTTDSADAYRAFLVAYPEGKWAQEARIRIENFALGTTGEAIAATTVPVPSQTAAAPTATSASASSTVAHRVQLGAFSTEPKARAEWDRLRAALPELQGLISDVRAADTAAGRLYRLQVGVASEKRGRDLCSLLQSRQQACLYVAP